MQNDFVEIEKITKSFDGKPAVENINASIQKGKITGLVGPDGAGKTTLIRLITGLLIPDEGKITVAGLDSVKQTQKITDIIGYMPQKFGLYEDLSVMENLNLYADLRCVLGKKRKETFEKLLNFTSLSPFTCRLAGKLSGGMKQKLGLACALVSKPELLLLDEPGVGVDPISRRDLWSMVQELLRENITVLWSTAYLDEAEQCEMILLMNEGKVLYDGSPKELTQKMDGKVYQIRDIDGSARNLLKNVLNEDNVIDGVIQGASVRVILDNSGKILNTKEINAGDEAKLIRVKPRFEDSFIDILGGGPGGDSKLVKAMPQIERFDKPVIEAVNLTKKYGDFAAAKDINFSIKSGEIFGLLGPNGAGKSTTFKMMCGLSTPTSGTASVMGFDLKTASGKARSHIGYMAQKFSLYQNLSIMQNLEFFSGIYGLKNKEKKEKIAEIIEIFNFEKYLNSNSFELPLGYKQRLALACAVMHNPPVLFLDEPTSGVDPITRREFWTHINNMVEKGVTVMVTTHFMDEAEYCDRISLIYKGQAIAIGSPDDLKNLVKTDEITEPTMEEAFILLIKKSDEKTNGKGTA